MAQKKILASQIDVGTASFQVAPGVHTHNTSDIIGLGSYYIQDTVGAMLSGNTESGISVTYDNIVHKINFNVYDPVITLTGDVTGSATMTNLGNVSIATTLASSVGNGSIALFSVTPFTTSVPNNTDTYGILLTGVYSDPGLYVDTNDGYTIIVNAPGTEYRVITQATWAANTSTTGIGSVSVYADGSYASASGNTHFSTTLATRSLAVTSWIPFTSSVGIVPHFRQTSGAALNLLGGVSTFLQTWIQVEVR